MANERRDGPTDLYTTSEARRALRQRPRLVWADATGDHQAVIERVTVVGAAERADIVVANTTVSRLHAEFEPRADGLWVRDLWSRNGTWVDRVQVAVARVPEGSRIRLGSAVLTLDQAPVQTEVELWPDAHFGALVGRSTSMRELFATLARVAADDAPVLLEGETGTGKDTVARTLHDASRRAGGPFVVVDCAALPERFAHDELFGHAAGAFEGAPDARPGAFEMAEGGTLYLDEVGELPLAAQSALVRAVESSLVRRLGETSDRALDLRVVASTRHNLRSMIGPGRFREDLFFRLARHALVVPPLRSRADDIAPLVASFAPDLDDRVRDDLVDRLLDHPFPGNVRELRNEVERARAYAARGIPARPSASAPPLTAPAADPPLDAAFDLPYREFREATERAYLTRLLARHQNNATQAALAAGIDRTYIYRLLRKHER